MRSLQCMFVARESVVCYLHAMRTFVFTVHLLLTDVVGGTLAAAFTVVCSGCLFMILLSCYLVNVNVKLDPLGHRYTTGHM